MKVATEICSAKIAERIGHLPDATMRDMLNWLRITKGLPDGVIAEAAELCGIHPKYAFRGIWEDYPEVSYSYLWHMHWMTKLDSRGAK